MATRGRKTIPTPVLVNPDMTYDWRAAMTGHPEWSYEDKMSVVTLYAIEGSLAKVSKKTRVPKTTIDYWKNHSPWWPYALNHARRLQDEVTDAKMTKLIEESIDQIDNRLSVGDEFVSKEGGVHNVKVKARDLATIMNSLMARRAEMRRDRKEEDSPTLSTKESLEQVMKTFLQVAGKRAPETITDVEYKVHGSEEVSEEGEATECECEEGGCSSISESDEEHVLYEVPVQEQDPYSNTEQSAE